MFLLYSLKYVEPIANSERRTLYRVEEAIVPALIPMPVHLHGKSIEKATMVIHHAHFPFYVHREYVAIPVDIISKAVLKAN